MHSLTMNDNSIGGSIPKEIAKLSNLEFLDLSGNMFSGTLIQKDPCTRTGKVNLTKFLTKKYAQVPFQLNWAKT